jgi:hypothetical protein
MKRCFWLYYAFAFACLRLLSASPQDTPGLRYEYRKTAAPHAIHILEVDPHRLRIEAVRALSDGVGRETVSSMAQRTGAIAAVNAGFFRIGGRYDGEPDGILKIGEQWFSDPAGARGAIGWSAGGETCRIGRLIMKWKLQSRGATYPVDGINRPRGPAEAILYNWAFHRSSLTDPGGTEILIARNRVARITRDGNAAIPADGFVYSLGPQAPVKTADLKPNTPVRVTYELVVAAQVPPTGKSGWQGMDYIVGGMPALLLARRAVFEPNQEKVRAGFAEELHPRTAVGLRADGTWVFVVVDGRQPGLSIGMNLKQVTELLQSLDCVDALNLDGGGSSTLYLQGKVVNSPSDAARERPVSDAIIVRRK